MKERIENRLEEKTSQMPDSYLNLLGYTTYIWTIVVLERCIVGCYIL